jgi:hypothetical protein
MPPKRNKRKDLLRNKGPDGDTNTTMEDQNKNCDKNENGSGDTFGKKNDSI